MKKLLSLALISGLLMTAASSCKKDKGGNTTTTTTNNSIVVPIDRSDTTTLPMPITGYPIDLDLSSNPVQIDTFATKVDEYISPYGFTKADMQKVELTKLRINIENDAAQTFNFVKDNPVSLKVYVDSFGGNSPRLVAHRDNIPQGVNVLDMTIDPTDIKDLFRAQYMKISLAFIVKANESVSGNAKFRVNYSFEVTAKKP